VSPDRWFNNKPLWQRAIVIAAGPLMNVVLAILLYGLLAAIGAQVPESEILCRIGGIAPESPAATAPLYLAKNGLPSDTAQTPDATGWQVGDIIRSVRGNQVENVMDVAVEAILCGGNPCDVSLDRPNPDGTTTAYVCRIAPKVMKEGGHPIFGVTPFDAALVADILKDTPAAQADIRKGDEVLRVNGAPVDITSFIRTTEQIPEGGTMTIDLMRDGKPLSVSMQPRTIGRFAGLSIAGAYDPATGKNADGKVVVGAVSEEQKKQSGLLARDIILEVDGQPATPKLMYDIERERPGQSVIIKVDRPKIGFGVLRPQSSFSTQLAVSPVRAIGVQLEPKTVFHRYEAARVPAQAWGESWKAIDRTIETLKMLVMGQVSPKDLGGPVMIGRIVTSAAEEGYAWLMRITAFISINLGIFNMLPLPILDGGQLVLFSVESLRRKPLNQVFVERFQQVGFFMIISLMLYVTYNDIARWFTDLVPK
jgi:regulator of sigma E protease